MRFPVPQALAAVDMTAFGKVLSPIVSNVVYPAIELIFAVAVVIFAWGIFQMIYGANSEEARTHGKWSIVGGVIGMFIMLSVWGIINLISNTVKGL